MIDSVLALQRVASSVLVCLKWKFSKNCRNLNKCVLKILARSAWFLSVVYLCAKHLNARASHVFATVLAHRQPADGNRCSFFSACLLHLELNRMLLHGDNICAFQIFPATRTEAVLFCFSGGQQTSKGGWPCRHD